MFKQIAFTSVVFAMLLNCGGPKEPATSSTPSAPTPAPTPAPSPSPSPDPAVSMKFQGVMAMEFETPQIYWHADSGGDSNHANPQVLVPTNCGKLTTLTVNGATATLIIPVCYTVIDKFYDSGYDPNPIYGDTLPAFINKTITLTGTYDGVNSVTFPTTTIKTENFKWTTLTGTDDQIRNGIVASMDMVFPNMNFIVGNDIVRYSYRSNSSLTNLDMLLIKHTSGGIGVITEVTSYAKYSTTDRPIRTNITDYENPSWSTPTARHSTAIAYDTYDTNWRNEPPVLMVVDSNYNLYASIYEGSYVHNYDNIKLGSSMSFVDSNASGKFNAVFDGVNKITTSASTGYRVYKLTFQ